MSQLIPVPELIRKLKLHKQYKNLAAIAAMGEISYDGLRKTLRDGKMSVRMQTLLSEIVLRLDRGDVRIRKNPPKSAHGENVGKFLLEERPVDAPQTQRRIVKACDYSKWARCIACGNTRFSMIRRTLNGGEKPRYYACDGCVNDPERIMMGQYQY